MKKERIVAWGLICALFLTMGFVAGKHITMWKGEAKAPLKTENPIATEGANEIHMQVLKFACPFSEGSFQSQVLQKFCDFANQKFAPEIYIQFYDGGKLGPEWDTMDALQNRRLEMCAVSTVNLSYLEESATIPYALPFAIESPEAFSDLMESDTSKQINKKLEEQGLYHIGYFYNGLRYIWSREPIYTKEDLKKICLRVPPMVSFESSFEGIVESTLTTNTSEILVNLKTGTIDAYEQAISEVMETELYQYTPYCLKLGHCVSSTSILVSEEVLALLSEEQIQELYGCAEAATTYAQMLYGSLNTAWERDFSGIGIEFVELSTEDFEDVKSTMQKNFMNALR